VKASRSPSVFRGPVRPTGASRLAGYGMYYGEDRRV